MRWSKSDTGQTKRAGDTDNATATDFAELFSRLAAGDIDKTMLKQVAKSLRRSLRFTRKGVTISGQGLADILIKTAPLIPIRSADALSQQYGGMSGPALAGHVIRSAGRSSAAIGGLTGALASAGELAPPMWVMLPAEVIAETMIIAAIEMKLVAELHEIYGQPITGTANNRGIAIVEAWSERRGVSMEDLAKRDGVSRALSRGTRSQIVQLVRRKLMARAARNVSSLAPLFIGAAAGAELNRRATRDLGDALVRDLARR